MPRKARVDYPGALHHVIGRGIERRFVLSSSEEKSFFLDRLTMLCRRHGLRCYAWCLMDNHYHLLLETGQVPLRQVMSSLLTSYALFYNRTHRRVGHVFQNRYQSILCEKDAYLLELVRYIHLNPIRASMMDLSALDRHHWCGHREVICGKQDGIISVKPLLSLFADRRQTAIGRYRAFLNAGLGKSCDYEGGGLRRSLAGETLQYFSGGQVERINYDQRVLGSGEFVDEALSRLEQIAQTPSHGVSFEQLARQVAAYYGIAYQELFVRRHVTPFREARVVLIYLADQYADAENHASLGRHFGIGRTAISMAVRQGRYICREKSFEETILQSTRVAVRAR